MSFTTGAALLDAVVLAIVSKEPEGAYGYKITQEIKQALDLSESTLYPVLRRLQKDGHLTAYDASPPPPPPPPLLHDPPCRTGPAGRLQGRVERLFRQHPPDLSGGLTYDPF